MSAVKMRQGHSKQMNYWMRARVALQGVTLVVLVVGAQAIQRKRTEDAAIAAAGGELADDSSQKKRLHAKEEFEERLRAAEEITEMETNAGLSGARAVKGPVVNREEEHRRREVQEQGPGATSAAVKQSSSWKWWSSKDKDKGNGES